MSDAAPALARRRDDAISPDPPVRGATPVLAVSLLGGVGLTVDEQPVRLANRKARAILAYLALSEHGEEQRERLAGLFWSEFEETNARASLRQVVHETREALSPHGVTALHGTRLSLILDPNAVRVDVADLLARVALQEAPDALLRQTRLAETLMAGLEDLDPAFHVWLLARRQTLHDRLTRGLEDGYRQSGLSRRDRRRLAEAMLRLDPTHEEACRVAMRCAAEAGETGAALRLYDELYQLLGDEYDMEPSQATQSLWVEVKQGVFEGAPPEPDSAHDSVPPISVDRQVDQVLVPPRRNRPAPAAPRPAPPKPALFIEGFAMNGVDPTRMHLVEGFRLDLVACLVRFREWYVAGTDTAEPAAPTGAPVSSRYTLTTTAYQAGASINVVMVLQERDAGMAVWSERFELRLDNWFETQQRVVRRIAATLNVQLSTERLVRLAAEPDVSLEAYDLWLRGQSLIRYFSPDNWNRAAQLFAEGIRRAPDISPLYSSLVQMNNAVHFVHPGLFRDPAKLAHTLTLAQQAVQLDPRDSRAELCLGWSLAFNRRYVQAEVHMGIACELNPNDSWTVIAAAMFHAFCGNAARATELSRQALEMTLSPGLNHWVYQASISYLCGDAEGAVAAADRAQDALRTVPAWRAAALCELGRHAEARREVERFYAGIRGEWFGEQAASDAQIGRWLLHAYPISRPETWQRLRDGLAAAGIPVRGCRHEG
jgi:DNA-binding SARP family transcriptional activator/TolB-like protein